MQEYWQEFGHAPGWMHYPTDQAQEASQELEYFDQVLELPYPAQESEMTSAVQCPRQVGTVPQAIRELYRDGKWDELEEALFV